MELYHLKAAKKSGMSLVELTVSMAVTTLIVGILIFLITDLSNQWKRINNYFATVRPAQRVFNRLCNDLIQSCYYDYDNDCLLNCEVNDFKDRKSSEGITQHCSFYIPTANLDTEHVEYFLRAIESDGSTTYALFRSNENNALLTNIINFSIKPRLCSVQNCYNDNIPRWIDVMMEISDCRENQPTLRSSLRPTTREQGATHMFRRRIIIPARP